MILGVLNSQSSCQIFWTHNSPSDQIYLNIVRISLRNIYLIDIYFFAPLL